MNNININKQYLKEFELVLTIYLKQGILPVNKKNIKSKEFGPIILDFIKKELNNDWDKYYQILFEVVKKYLKNKKTKSAKIILDEIEKEKDNLIKIWQKGVNKKQKEQLETKIYNLSDRLVAKMLKSHLAEADKVQESFYNLFYFIYNI